MKRGLYLLVALALGACETTPPVQAIGGSKSDGTVAFAYEYGLFEKPHPDLSTTEENATQRCKVWGYSRASAFNNGIASCLAYNGYGNCVKTRVTITYQCMD